MTIEALKSNLRELFLAAASAAHSRLAELNVPLVVSTDETYVVRKKDGSGWSSETRTIERNILGERRHLNYNLAPLLPEEVILTAQSCAEELTRSPDAHLPFFVAGNYNRSWLLTHSLGQEQQAIPEYNEDPAQWTQWQIVLPALQHYLCKLPRLDAAKIRDAEQFASDVVQVTHDETLQYEAAVPLAGIRISPAHAGGLTGGSATLRPLSGQEQARFLDSWGIGHQNPFLSLPSTTLTVRISAPREAPNPDPRLGVHPWLCALYLHGFALAGRTASAYRKPEWLSPGTWSNPLRMSEQSFTSKLLTPAGMKKVQRTAEGLDGYSLGEPKSARDFALHRFYLGASRFSSADALIDFVVALESLLLPADPKARHGDLTYRFRMHGAHYLSRTKSERAPIFKQLNSLYDLRSSLVHGTKKYPSGADIEAGMQSARELASRGLLRAVEEGFPTHEHLQRMALGA